MESTRTLGASNGVGAQNRISDAVEVGIERMVISAPGIAIRSSALEEELGFGSGKISEGLMIKEIRLPGPSQSNATMMADGLYRFIKDIAGDGEALKKLKKEPIRSIYFSTESSPDRSRPELEPAILMACSKLAMESSAYADITEMLKRARVVPITYACVGGVLALGDAVNEVTLGTYRADGGSALVIAADTSVYSDDRAKNAEGTQGAASALMWITRDPSLVSVYNGGWPSAFHGAFADFTKYGEETPFVHAKFSKMMYAYALAESLEAMEGKGTYPELDKLDFFIAHVPFPKQTEYFMGFLYAHYLRHYDSNMLKEIEGRDGVGPEPIRGHSGFTDMMRAKINEFNLGGTFSESEFVDKIENDPELWKYWDWTGKLRKQDEFRRFKKDFMMEKALEKPSLVGNSYSASVFVSLASLLSNISGNGRLSGMMMGYGSGAEAVGHPIAVNPKQEAMRDKLRIDLGRPVYLGGKAYRDLHAQLVKGEAKRMMRTDKKEDLASEERRITGTNRLPQGFHVRSKNCDGTGEYFYVDAEGNETDICIRI